MDNLDSLRLRAAAQIGGLNDYPAIFVDWLTVGQRVKGGPLPIVVGGVASKFDSEGNCVFERALPSRFEGSHSTTVGVCCDSGVYGVSGNVGRFGRPDNLFNLGWSATLEKASRILAGAALPSLSNGTRRPPDFATGQNERRTWEGRGAIVSRIDLTCNFAAGSDAQARAVIRWLQGQSIRRLKRGFSGDESVWWSNTRMMLKAYRKGPEMKAHGGDPELIEWANDNGIVRVEVELKKRELDERGLRDLSDITQDKLEAVFHECMEPFKRVDSSDEPDILAAIPARSRAYAAAWLAGQDVRLLCSQATLYRHARVLREYGLDVLEPRNIERFPVKVRVIDLVPCTVPEWYLKRVAA